ncbi:MAG: hypothetical protein EAY75_04715 [Bacteroidetes bacterium]|nr:MAG: hypothetical protein EAY75_04715 [Bacteroidota bacterium]
MHPDLLDILTHKDLPISNEQLVNYLSGKLTPAESQKVEQAITNAGAFENEALEGWLQIKNKQKVEGLNHQLLQGLHQTLHSKKKTRRRHKLLQLPWMLVLAAGLLALAFVTWWIIHLLGQQA